MHPEKFLARELPVKIEFADLSSVFGKDWARQDVDVNGEFGYQVILAEFIPKREARAAAEGWGGDRYALFENKTTGATVLVEYTAWDTARDAKEFFDAYSERTEKRYKVSKPTGAQNALRVYETSEGLVSIELRDKDVAIIEGALNAEQLAQLNERLWLSKKR
jgi:hypothetical protein